MKGRPKVIPTLGSHFAEVRNRQAALVHSGRGGAAFINAREARRRAERAARKQRGQS